MIYCDSGRKSNDFMAINTPGKRSFMISRSGVRRVGPELSCRTIQFENARMLFLF